MESEVLEPGVSEPIKNDPKIEVDNEKKDVHESVESQKIMQQSDSRLNEEEHEAEDSSK